MTKYFVALVGDGDSGKTKTLDELIQVKDGVYLRERNYAFLQANVASRDMVVFVQRASPQERGRETTIDEIKKDLALFEKIASWFRISEYCALMAFTSNTSKKKGGQRLLDAENYVKQQNFRIYKVRLDKNTHTNLAGNVIKSYQNYSRQARELQEYLEKVVK